MTLGMFSTRCGSGIRVEQVSQIDWVSQGFSYWLAGLGFYFLISLGGLLQAKLHTFGAKVPAKGLLLYSVTVYGVHLPFKTSAQ